MNAGGPGPFPVSRPPLCLTPPSSPLAGTLIQGSRLVMNTSAPRAGRDVGKKGGRQEEGGRTSMCPKHTRRFPTSSSLAPRKDTRKVPFY